MLIFLFSLQSNENNYHYQTQPLHKKANMNIGRLGLLLVLPVLCAAPSAAQDTVPAAQALLEQFDEMYRSTGTAARIEIKIECPKKVRTMQMRSWSQGEDKALQGRCRYKRPCERRRRAHPLRRALRSTFASLPRP